MHKTILAAALALGLGGCLTPTPAPSPATPVASAIDPYLVAGTQALIHAEAAYTVAARATTAAVRSGVIPASYAPYIREVNQYANAALDAGGRAQSGADKLRHASMVRLMTDRLRSLLPGGG